MGKTGALLSLLMVGLIAQSALCSSGINRRSWNIFADEESDSQLQKGPTAFRAGQEYIFEYNGQVASGLLQEQDWQMQQVSPNTYDSAEYGSESADAEKQQKSVLRIHSKAKIIFNSEHRATLRLEHTLLGKLNHAVADPKRIQPMQMFEKKSIEEQKQRELQLPTEFKYVDGVVEQIQFHPEDKPWSKNVKRAVLNLIQLNLNRKNIKEQSQWNQFSSDEEKVGQKISQKAFTIPETTIEGSCLTTYTINENKRQDQNEELFDDDEKQWSNQFNVTKSINFKRCNKIADVAYGYQSQDDQTVKCARIQAWQQQQREQGQGQEQYALFDEESCDPKEINSDKLDRSAIQRFELVRKSDNTYAIKRAEALSLYTLKNIKAEVDNKFPSAMHTVAIAELIYRGSKPSANSAKASHYQLKQLDSENIESESLLFDNEWDVERKRFFMYGDAEISRESSPYRNVQHKVDQAQIIYRRLIHASTDKNNGMEAETVAQLQRLVEILRMCSVDELESIYENIQESQKQQQSRADVEKVQQLLADTLAIAGTRNTVYVLVQKMNSKQLSPSQAAQALKSLHGIPAPSDAITDIVVSLCKNELAHRSPALKQTCWLTFGAMVGELCRDKLSAKAQRQEQENWTQQPQRQQWLAYGVQSGFDKSQVCPPAKKESYQQALLHQYKHAETTYEKILALKAIGNAGLDTTVHELERIANGQHEKQPMVRIVAIDALRRLRTQMPRKIQRICLPIFQNTNEKTGLRLAALSLLISTQPEHHILDQIVYTLSKERSTEVQSFTYSMMTLLSQSQIPQDQEMAKHLKSALKVAQLDEEVVRTGSNKWYAPIYSNQQQEGFALKWISIFTENQMLPAHIGVGLDTILNGKWQNDIFKVSLSQQGTNRWIENLMQTLILSGKRATQTRGSRDAGSKGQRSDQEFSEIISSLGLKSRQNQRLQNEQETHIMACARLGDVDHAILPISEHNLPQWLKKILENAEQPSLASVIAEFASKMEKQHVRWLSALNFNEKLAKVPTPVGFPLNIQQSTPMLSYIEAGAKMQSESSQMKTEVKAHAIVSLVHMQKMEIWTPFLTTGVESTRGFELNVPLHLDIQVQGDEENENKQNGLRLSWKVPQSQKTRFFGLHTMCTTFVNNQNNKKKEIRTIYNPILERSLPQVVEVNKMFGENKFGMPIRVNGHFHLPREWSDYSQIVQILMATENHLHIELEQSPSTPREVVFQVQGSLFQKTQAQQHTPELQNFYSDAEKQFLPAYPEDVEGMDLDDNSQRRQKLSKTLQRLQQQQGETQMYKHFLKFSVEANGRKQAKAEMKIQAVCDAKFFYCKMVNEIKRSPLFPEETSTWTLKQKIQTLAPESVSSIRELEQLRGQKNQKFFVQMENEWGTEERSQFIKIRLHGENAQTKEQRQWQEETSDEQEQYNQKRVASFINKYDIVSDYKLNAYAQNIFQRVFEVLKTYYFWNTESRIEQSGRDGQLFASVVIDPITQRQWNVSVRTPTQAVRIINAQLPIRICPMPLVRASQRPTHSLVQAFSRFTSDSRAECRTDGRRVETFDGVLYKTPINKCYTVLAKDCSNVEEPKFAVLMKSLSEDGQQKKVKVITPEQVIECQPEQQQMGNWKSQKIVCKINGQEISAQQQWNALSTAWEQEDSKTVEYNNDEQTSVTINVNGVFVRFGCQCANCECQRVWIKLADTHKNTQCGLCGHYDDTLTDEWRMSNNELTQDLAQFHRSYSLKDNEECTESKQANFYSNNKQHFRVLSKWQKQQNQARDEEFEQQQYGGYAQEDQSDEEWNRFPKTQKWSDSEEIVEPKMKTKVVENNERICFSTQPVKQCPFGTRSELDDEEDTENLAPQKFACLSRSSSEARRLQHEVRRGKIVNVSTLEPNFVHSVSVPTKCVRYY